MAAEAMVLQLHRMMVRLPVVDDKEYFRLDFFLVGAKVLAVREKQCYNLLAVHQSLDLDYHKPFLPIPDHEKSRIRIL